MTFRDIPHQMGGEGHKFGLPETPLARTDHLKKRYDPVVDQLTKGVMRSGKLSLAQRVWNLDARYQCASRTC
jgi:ribosomal protein S7